MVASEVAITVSIELLARQDQLSLGSILVHRSLLALAKTGRRLVKHASYYWLLLAEGHLTRKRFASMLRRIAMLPLPAS